jgi:hypothetical protein
MVTGSPFFLVNGEQQSAGGFQNKMAIFKSKTRTMFTEDLDMAKKNVQLSLCRKKDNMFGNPSVIENLIRQ